MDSVLSRLLEGDLNVDDFKKYLKTGKNLVSTFPNRIKIPRDADPSNYIYTYTK